VERFGQIMREKLTTGEVPFRKAYLGAIVDRIEIDDHQIRIVGRKDVLEQAVLANGQPVPGVRSFVRKWRRRVSTCILVVVGVGETHPSVGLGG
jgi:site-specific DNA recombinase